ncbi:MAG: CPBP family intramembrane metalloprotease [Candidatus Riflebacteria bacterium]|nr:CPBP family intramembrane metalloprotease [Candidatus Riflebacteria bacterium]
MNKHKKRDIRASENKSETEADSKDLSENISLDAEKKSSEYDSQIDIDIESESQKGKYEVLFWTVLGIAGTALFFVLRTSIVRIFPLLIILFLFGCLLMWLYRKYFYRDLEEVRYDYFSLNDLLSSRGMKTYLKIIDNAWLNLVKARDRAEHVRSVLAGIDIASVEKAISRLKEQQNKENDEQKLRLVEAQLTEVEERRKMYYDMEVFLKKFEANKMSFLNSCRGLKMKIEMKDLGTIMKKDAKTDEMDLIVNEIDKLNEIFDKVDS